MVLQKKVFHPNPDRKPTKEELEKRELAWKILQEKGSVCITDPLQPVENMTNNSYGVTGPFCDYYDGNGDVL